MAAVMAMAQPSQYAQGPATLLNTLLSTYALAAAAKSAIAKVTPLPLLYRLKPMGSSGVLMCFLMYHACSSSSFSKLQGSTRQQKASASLCLHGSL